MSTVNANLVTVQPCTDNSKINFIHQQTQQATRMTTEKEPPSNRILSIRLTYLNPYTLHTLYRQIIYKVHFYIGVFC